MRQYHDTLQFTQSSLISSVVLGRSFSGPLKYSREDLIMLIYVLLLLYYVMNLVIMAPKKFAVFGDSYVSRQGRFGLQMHFGDGSKVKYFGLGGMIESWGRSYKLMG